MFNKQDNNSLIRATAFHSSKRSQNQGLEPHDMEETTEREIPQLVNEASDEHRFGHYLGRYGKLRDANEGGPDLS